MKKSYLLYLGVLIFGVPSISFANETYLQDEINQLKDDIVVIQRQLYRDKNDTTAPAESVSTFQIKLGEYDQMIRDMNGKVESFEYRINNIEKKLEMIDKDIELRFEQMKRNAEISTPISTQEKPKAPEGVKAKDLYENALNDLKANKLNDAEKKFSQFLGSFADDKLAGNAQYWLGEVYYKQQNFAKAAVAFKDGYSKYPDGSKGPDCLLKLGLTMKALDKKTEACTAFVNLPKVFDNVNSEIANRAKKEAEALACK
jgi:tol-pal system protein YbgF